MSSNLTIAGRRYLPDREINYIVAQYSFNISWADASDNFGIYDYYVGIATSQNLTTSPDLVPFRSTMRQRFASLYSSRLMPGRQFFVVVKAEDHVLLSDVSVFGPIILDTSPPTINGTATSVRRDHNIITISWQPSMIMDDEQEEPLTNYEYAIGEVISHYIMLTLNFVSF